MCFAICISDASNTQVWVHRSSRKNFRQKLYMWHVWHMRSGLRGQRGNKLPHSGAFSSKLLKAKDEDITGNYKHRHFSDVSGSE